MTHTLRVTAIVGAALAVLFVSSSRADDVPKPAQMPDAAAMEQMMAEYAKVGPEHKVLQHLVGKWNTKVTSYCPTADKPEVSEGTSEFKSILGGRFVAQHFQATVQGEPFEGMGVCGYDNAQKKYTGAWIDNMGTGIMHTKGEWDQAAKTMTEIGKFVSPMGPMQMKLVSKVVDDNKFTFTMYWLLPDGAENKMMEIVYTRQ